MVAGRDELMMEPGIATSPCRRANIGVFFTTGETTSMVCDGGAGIGPEFY